MTACPHCGRDTESARADTMIDDLRRWCRENGHHVLAGDRVAEQTAARLLGRAVGTLRNWSSQDRPLPYTSVRGRRTYKLADIGDMLSARFD